MSEKPKYVLDLTGLGYDESSQLWRAKSGMNYSFVFAYEKKFFDPEFLGEYFHWGQNYWYICLVYALIYVIAIHAGQHYMKDRTRFDMRKGLAAWNIVLALFSTMGSIRLLPEFLYTLKTHGFVHSFCVQDYAHGVSGCWIALFVGSKFAELLDTFFIVIRKQKLIFLHWYHHTTVLVYCWYATHDLSSTGRIFSLVNFSVHSVMYSYYAFRAFRFNVPKYIMIAITTGQITQMVLGVVVNTWAFWIKTHGGHCGVSYNNLRFCFFIFLTYLFLFSYFFYETYIKKGGKRAGAARPSVTISTDSKASSLVNGHANGHAMKKIN